MNNVTTAENTSRFSADSDKAWSRVDCPHCSGTTARVVARHDYGPIILWMRCVHCGYGFVKNGDAVSPSVLPLRLVEGLDEGTAHAWDEVRGCLSVSATTAAVHMCRKILFHIAVDQGLPAKGKNDRAPSFYQCIEHLEDVGLVTPPMKDWVDQIREIGNQGAHELSPISAAEADLVARFSLQLLVLTYEMADALAEVAPLPEEETEAPA